MTLYEKCKISKDEQKVLDKYEIATANYIINVLRQVNAERQENGENTLSLADYFKQMLIAMSFDANSKVVNLIVKYTENLAKISSKS